MSKKCKCRDNREQRRCPNVTPLTLAIASNTDFLRRGPRGISILPRSNINLPTVALLVSRGEGRNNSTPFSANSQTVV